MSPSELSLLLDLGRLATKYGPETFESLARVIRSPDATASLTDVLVTMAQATRNASGKTKEPKEPPADRSAQRVIDRIEKTDPDKAIVLRMFYEDIRRKKCLPKLRDVVAFLAGNGTRAIRQKSRSQATVALLRQLALLPLEQVQRRVREATDFSATTERSLEGWSRIILGKKEVPREVEPR